MSTSDINFHKGLLIRWDSQRGFGFIDNPTNKNGVFIHISAFENPERRPIIGDTILYQLNLSLENKPKAFDAYIKGVKRASKQRQNKPLSTSAYNSSSNTQTPTSYHTTQRRKISFRDMMLLIITILFIGSGLATLYEFITNKTTSINSTTSTKNSYKTEEQDYSHDFKCDGRIYCSQMNSREEAIFFDKNCPGTKMRSTPGEPCKNDSRW